METKDKRFHIDKKFILIASIVAAACIIAMCTFIVTGSSQRKLNSLLDTGDKYLSELDYEQAVAAYLAAISIDPKCEDAYLGLADAYVAMGKLDEALDVLSEGYELTVSRRVAAMMEEINGLLAQKIGTKSDSHGEENNQGSSDKTDDAGLNGTDAAEGNAAGQSGVTFVSWADAGLEDHVMEWGDEGLERSMRKVTGITEGDIMLSDVWEITDLRLGICQISDISPLSSLTNLTCLYLPWSQISDISPLSSLNNLTILVLEDNQITNVSPLASLNNLTFLSLVSNQISDISPLSSLNNLTFLGLNNNQISDVSPLSSLTNLTHLGLDNNQISDVSPLSSLTNLIQLGLSHNQISDISPLSSLKDHLAHLYLSYNKISDVSPLSSLNHLIHLNLDGNNITDYSPLDHFAEGVVQK